MKLEKLIAEKTIAKLPVSFQYFKPLDITGSLFVNRYVGIKRYQSPRCRVHPPLKPISKII